MVKVNALVWACVGMAGWADALWPIPAQYVHGNDTAWLAPNVQLVYNAPANCSVTNDTINTAAQARISAAWERTKRLMFNESFVPWKFHARGSKFEPAADSGFVIDQVVITQTAADVASTYTYEDLPGAEDYNLTIPGASGALYPNSTATATGRTAGSIYIDATSSLGVLHGLTTLTQLFYASETNPKESIYSPLIPVDIVDKPLYLHRGLNLDVARQWYDVQTILKTIDALSWNKMNRLHLHVTDSQSWPLEIPALPELAQKGAYHATLTYSPEDIQEILSYAEDRGIQVLIEIDMPGHTASIAESMPDLITGFNKQPNWGDYAAQPPSGSLKLNNTDVEDFVTTLFGDLLPRLRDHTSYQHTGGDEVNANVYQLDPGVLSNESSVLIPLLGRFVAHAHEEVAKYQMSPIVWEEMLLQWNLTSMAKDTIVQTWQSAANVKLAAAQGYRVIAGDVGFWYLDCGNGQWLDFGPNVYATYYPFNDWCSPKKSWRLVYSYDPVAGLTEDEKKLVLGAEVHIWSEQIDPVSLDVMLWPRGSAAAEVLWSGRTDAQGVNRTFADASPRLGEMRERMVLRGVNASPFTQLWCLQNPGNCELN